MIFRRPIVSPKICPLIVLIFYYVLCTIIRLIVLILLDKINIFLYINMYFITNIENVKRGISCAHVHK